MDRMLDLNPETVLFIINKAQEFQTPEPEESDEAPDPDPESFVDTVVRPQPSDPIYEELRSTIDDLEPDQQICLVALMWLGRGDFALEEWRDALGQARDAHNERTAEYLIATPLLSEYLEEGLNAHGYTCE